MGVPGLIISSLNGWVIVIIALKITVEMIATKRARTELNISEI